MVTIYDSYGLLKFLVSALIPCFIIVSEGLISDSPFFISFFGLSICGDTNEQSYSVVKCVNWIVWWLWCSLLTQ